MQWAIMIWTGMSSIWSNRNYIIELYYLVNELYEVIYGYDLSSHGSCAVGYVAWLWIRSWYCGMGKSWTLNIFSLFLLYLLYFLHYFLKVWIKNIYFMRWIQRSWTCVNSVKATLIKVWSLPHFFLLANRGHKNIYNKRYIYISTWRWDL